MDSPLGTFPLVGRGADLERLRDVLVGARAGRGSTVVLSGEGGVGKTRLVAELAAEAGAEGWTVARGRAYPVETGIPYALFADAFLPILRELDPGALATLSRGGEAELTFLFPTLRAGGARVSADTHGADPSEFRTRILWSFIELLRHMAARSPLLVVLEDLHWADESSLDLLHFVSRQTTDARVALLATYNEAELHRNPALVRAQQSLVSVGAAARRRLEPLSRTETDELVRTVFGVDPEVSREFSALIYGWTRGNPFFLAETLKELVSSGRLHRREGTWLGWEVRELGLPATIRDAVLNRLRRLSPGAASVAELTAVVGTRLSHDLLGSLSALPEDALFAALDELRAQHVLTESEEDGSIVYDFFHPLVREALYAELGLARVRSLHRTVAEALEARYGDAAMHHADELAYHFARADQRKLAAKAVRYLAAAGRLALARYADREAVNYLEAALERADDLAGWPGGGGAEGEEGPVPREDALLVDLARAHQRLGDYREAIALWERARREAEASGEPARLARIERRLGLAHFWSGRDAEALAHYQAGLEAARSAGDDGVRVRILLARGVGLGELGRPDEARSDIERALAEAEARGDRALLGRAHRALLFHFAWTGPPERAREHGERAVELAREAGDPDVAFWGHWGLAVVRGITGDTEAMARHIEESRRVAEQLRSPVLRLWTDEMSIELASATGEWDSGIALGERTIALARSLNQRRLLPRLLVWTSLMHLGRGDFQRARRLIDEAWEMSGAGDLRDPVDVHCVVPAHIGRAAYHLFAEEWEQAIEVGEAGLAIADRSGYVIWAIHRLLPIVAEASLWVRDLEAAKRIGARLRLDSERLGHRLGLAWADACDALVAWLEKDARQGAVLMRQAARSLEAIPVIPDAARIRRQLAGRLADLGDREGALEELRRVHDVFARLGAETELEKARRQFREVGARPPSRGAGEGVGGLTGRELEIALLVAEGRSNKAIGKALGISPRTVSTHLSNVYGKLDLRSRNELARMVRDEGLHRQREA